MSTCYELLRQGPRELDCLESSSLLSIIAEGPNHGQIVTFRDLTPERVCKLGQQLIHIASYHAAEEDIQKWLKEHHWQIGATL